MGLFHKHHHELLGIRVGPQRQTDKHCYEANIYRFYFCKCGEFIISLSGEERAKVTGKLPKYQHHDLTMEGIAEYLLKFTPEIEPLAPGETMSNNSDRLEDLTFEDTNLGGTPYCFTASEAPFGGVLITCQKEGRSTRDYRLTPEKVTQLRDWLTNWLEQEKQ